MLEFKNVIYKYKFVIFLFVGIILGTCYINLIKKGVITTMDIYSDNYLSDYIDISVNNVSLWQYIVKTRLRDFIILCGIGLTVFSNMILSAYMCYLGVCNGILISMAVLHYGLGGVLVYIVSVFPQYIFYGLTLYLITKLFTVSGYSIKTIVARNVIIIIAIAIGLLLVGTYFEAYINPVLLKKLYLYIY